MCRSLPPPMLFGAAEQQYLHQLSQDLPLSLLLSSARNQEAIGMDFVYHSARLAGNRYDRHDVPALLKDGRTAAKPFADAVMLLNLWRGYQYLLSCFDDKRTSIRDFIINSHALITQNRLPQRQERALDGLLAAGERLENPFDRALYWYDALAFGDCLPDGKHLTARQTAAFVLMRAGLFPCVVWGEGEAADGGGKAGLLRAYGRTGRRYGAGCVRERVKQDGAA